MKQIKLNLKRVTLPSDEILNPTSRTVTTGSCHCIMKCGVKYWLRLLIRVLLNWINKALWFVLCHIYIIPCCFVSTSEKKPWMHHLSLIRYDVCNTLIHQVLLWVCNRPNCIGYWSLKKSKIKIQSKWYYWLNKFNFCLFYFEAIISLMEFPHDSLCSHD
jgi:hypothetical protein